VHNHEFAHHDHYGDYSGVVFYGPPHHDEWRDRLAISDRFIDPLFTGILDRAQRAVPHAQVPRAVLEWNTLEGWASGRGPRRIASTDAADLASALAHLTPDDVAEHGAGCTVDECMRCAGVLREFIEGRLARGHSLFIEDD
jgi:hypothetical protein